MRKSLDDFITGAIAAKPRAKSRRLEDALHLQVAKYLRAVIGPERICNNGVAWESIETRGRRSHIEGAKNKARGCVSGTPDVHICYNGREYHIELKAEKGTLSDGQREWHQAFRDAGARIAVCRSIDDVCSILAFWEIPTREAKR